ncbi:MAG: hypothetical protein O2985_08495 [Proteobacteria bacterium]|nr:hypothetical protein [Pseudomonadota bacterium]
MLRKKLNAIGLWSDKQIWCPDIMLAWAVAIASVVSIAVWGQNLAA